jgi:hypothetical protein
VKKIRCSQYSKDEEQTEREKNWTQRKIAREMAGFRDRE